MLYAIGQSNTNRAINETEYDINLNYLATFCYEVCVALWPLEASRILPPLYATKFFFVSTQHLFHAIGVCPTCLFDVTDFAMYFDMTHLHCISSTFESRFIRLPEVEVHQLVEEIPLLQHQQLLVQLRDLWATNDVPSIDLCQYLAARIAMQSAPLEMATLYSNHQSNRTKDDRYAA